MRAVLGALMVLVGMFAAQVALAQTGSGEGGFFGFNLGETRSSIEARHRLMPHKESSYRNSFFVDENMGDKIPNLRNLYYKHYLYFSNDDKLIRVLVQIFDERDGVKLKSSVIDGLYNIIRNTISKKHKETARRDTPFSKDHLISEFRKLDQTTLHDAAEELCKKKNRPGSLEITGALYILLTDRASHDEWMNLFRYCSKPVEWTRYNAGTHEIEVALRATEPARGLLSVEACALNSDVNGCKDYARQYGRPKTDPF